MKTRVIQRTNRRFKLTRRGPDPRDGYFFLDLITLRLKTNAAAVAIKPLLDWEPLVPPEKPAALHQYLKTAIGHPPRGS